MGSTLYYDKHSSVRSYGMCTLKPVTNDWSTRGAVEECLHSKIYFQFQWYNGSVEFLPLIKFQFINSNFSSDIKYGKKYFPQSLISILVQIIGKTKQLLRPLVVLSVQTLFPKIISILKFASIIIFFLLVCCNLIWSTPSIDESISIQQKRGLFLRDEIES